MASKPNIPQFHFPSELKRGHKHKHSQAKYDLFMKRMSRLFQGHVCLTESEFEAVTNLCLLPRFMNLALFRAIDELNDGITFNQFKKSWKTLSQGHTDDIDLLIYSILKKPDADIVTPDGFLPILEDIVLHHPSLQFLGNNMAFQERYIETVICRIFYEAHCPTGKMTLKAFRKGGIGLVLRSLTCSVDLYNTRNVFSYIQFYVLYCKLWSLDSDHDLSITETDLHNYNMGTLSRLTIQRIMDVGHIMAFADPVVVSDKKQAEPPTLLTYFDFIWFLLSEVDKSTPMAIEYWFRCIDTDNDGILSFFELHKFWNDQERKQQYYGGPQSDGHVQFKDIMRQMNDLIQPQIPGQFSLKDLKKNGYLAERFFDTFVNFDRFRVHEAHQEGSIRQQQEYEHKLLLEKGIYRPYEPFILTDELGFPVLSNWNDYADIEYHRIIAGESYIDSYEDNESQHSDISEEEENFTISPFNENVIESTNFATTADSEDEIVSIDTPTIKEDDAEENNSTQNNENQSKSKGDKALKVEIKTLTISLDSSWFSDEILSPLINLSDTEESNHYDDDDDDDHNSIEDSGTSTPESPVIATPKTQLNQEMEGLSLKDTNTVPYFDLKGDRHHNIQQSSAIHCK